MYSTDILCVDVRIHVMCMYVLCMCACMYVCMYTPWVLCMYVCMFLIQYLYMIHILHKSLVIMWDVLYMNDWWPCELCVGEWRSFELCTVRLRIDYLSYVLYGCVLIIWVMCGCEGLVSLPTLHHVRISIYSTLQY